MEFKALHDAKTFIKECAEVLNEEWRRSLTARLHSLEKSRDSLPICLVLLLKDDSGKTSLIGHSRLSDMRGQVTKSCLVESVVVKKTHRGKGYGKILMRKTEEFAASKGYKTMYLTTHDKEDFYEHLGYEFCKPVVSLGSDILPDHLAEKLFGNLSLTSARKDRPPQKSSGSIISKEDKLVGKSTSKKDSETQPNNATHKQDSSQDSAEQSHALPPAPANAPPPPVAPPPPPPPPAVKNTDAAGEIVSRWDPSKVSWMKKHL